MTHPGTCTRIKHRTPGVNGTIVEHAGVRELHITLAPLPGERLSPMLWRLENLLREHHASVVKHDIFGDLHAADETMARLNRLLHDVSWPVTWTEGAGCDGSGVAGMQVFAVAETDVENVRLEGRVVGRAFSDEFARHCVLGDIHAADIHASREAQAQQTFQNIEAALDRAGMKMKDTVRTWLFLDGILSWYDKLNAVRTKFFTQRRLFDGLVPASTGVGGRNPAGAAMSAAAWAVQPLGRAFSVRELSSPLQCPAPRYGSCFSRAVELNTPTLRRALVSGTASIDAEGATVHAGNLPRQIQRTMDVVEAILASRRLGWNDVSRATAYFKHARSASVFAQWCAGRGITLPVLNVECAICRDDLLFELEVDALAPAIPRGEAREADAAHGKLAGLPGSGGRA